MSTLPSPNSTVPAPLMLAVLVVVIAVVLPSNPSVPRRHAEAAGVAVGAAACETQLTALHQHAAAVVKRHVEGGRAAGDRLGHGAGVVEVAVFALVVVPGKSALDGEAGPGQVVEDAGVLLVEIADLTEPTAGAGVVERAAVQELRVTIAISGAQHQRTVGIDGPGAADRAVQPGQGAADVDRTRSGERAAR